MACPPSSVIATSNDILVRVEDFSNNIARVLLFNLSQVFPRILFSLRSEAVSSKLMISEYERSARVSK